MRFGRVVALVVFGLFVLGCSSMALAQKTKVLDKLTGPGDPGDDSPLDSYLDDGVPLCDDPNALHDSCFICCYGIACGMKQAAIEGGCDRCSHECSSASGKGPGLAPRALISGVPRYYQTDLDAYLPGDQCLGDDLYSGCGPVAGAAILGWWDRRGFSSLLDDSDVTAGGLPEQAIFDLGKGQYMDRASFCKDGTAVDPYRFLAGLRDFMDDRYSGHDFVVTKYKITTNGSGKVCYKKKRAGRSEQSCSTNMGHLRHIVKQQINKAQPMVLLLRADGQTNAGGTFKWANHYATVVGYDHRGSDLELIVQYNRQRGYQNRYSGTTRPIVLGDHTGKTAVAKYNLYTIEPGAPIGQDYVGECRGLLTNGTTYHDSSHDGVSPSAFEPHCDKWHGPAWGVSTGIHHQDDICFVARWH